TRCGNRSWAVEAGVDSNVGGVVVIRKSALSLYLPRRPTTEIGEALDIRSTTRNGRGKFGKISARNFAIWPVAASGTVVDSPAEDPFGLNNSNVTFPPAVPATAMPLWMLPGCPGVPEDSTYIRNAEPAFAGAPASVTVKAPGLYEKTTSG